MAKGDKATMRACLSFLRQTSDICNGILDVWDLIHVGMSAVRELDPESWVQSFKHVNLNPDERLGFPAWCKRIASFL